MFPGISRLLRRWRGAKSIAKLGDDHGRISPTGSATVGITSQQLWASISVRTDESFI